MCEIMEACVIMHNMIIKSERDTRKPLINEVLDFQGPMANPQPGVPTYREFVAVIREIRDEATHNRLHNDLVAHAWAIKTNQPAGQWLSDMFLS